MKGTELFARIAGEPRFSRVHPRVGAFFRGYLENEKAVEFADKYVINTHFPPYPSPAFDNLIAHFESLGDSSARRSYSVTLAVTNRCPYKCWHCYNAGRSQTDVPLKRLTEVCHELQELGAVHVTLSGGEPLVRKDLAEIAAAFDDRTYLGLNTTGRGLTADRAGELRDAGVFAVGVSLDSISRGDHDRMRGVDGSFETALAALETAGQAGMYPYVVSVATREFLERGHFDAFLDLVSNAGGREIHLLEPCAVGSLADTPDVVLGDSSRGMIMEYQMEAASRDDMPVVSSFLYLESGEAFGCGAGLTHIYIDGSGEVCPCNLVPLSFGNITTDSLGDILGRMGRHFQRPRCECVGHVLSPHAAGKSLPLGPEESEALCDQHLSKAHPVPAFFRVAAEAQTAVGHDELRLAYDDIHDDYDAYWLSEAAGPVDHLVRRVDLDDISSAIEAGAGTGYTTALLRSRMPPSARITAVDISLGMLDRARERVAALEGAHVEFVVGDALRYLRAAEPVDLVISTWVLGYISIEPFLEAAGRALKSGGCLAFVVHRDNSPREPLEVFRQLVAEDPSILQTQVQFDFPPDAGSLSRQVDAAGFDVEMLLEGDITFRCRTAQAAMGHLLKSGAGTAFFNAVDGARREGVSRQFVRELAARSANRGNCDVTHDYLSCVCRKRGASTRALVDR